MVLFGLVQVIRLYAAREILDYAASAGARAQAVGFNDFMVYKVVRVAGIPNAGRLTNPQASALGTGLDVVTPLPGTIWNTAVASSPTSPQLATEQSRIPLYLGAEDYGELRPILDYENWDDIRHSSSDLPPWGVRTRTHQELPLDMPFHRAFYSDDSIEESGEMEMESHYTLYLE